MTRSVVIKASHVPSDSQSPPTNWVVKGGVALLVKGKTITAGLLFKLTAPGRSGALTPPIRDDPMRDVPLASANPAQQTKEKDPFPICSLESGRTTDRVVSRRSTPPAPAIGAARTLSDMSRIASHCKAAPAKLLCRARMALSVSTPPPPNPLNPAARRMLQTRGWGGRALARRSVQ